MLDGWVSVAFLSFSLCLAYFGFSMSVTKDGKIIDKWLLLIS